MESSVKNKPTDLGLDKKQIAEITKALGAIGAIANKVTQPSKQSRQRKMKCNVTLKWALFYIRLADFYKYLGEYDNYNYYLGLSEGLFLACI